jgi:hypothetical protein
MHQYKTVAQILLILSIFNPVLAAPVVRDIYDARDDVALSVVVRNVAVRSKEQHQSRSDGDTAGPSSPPPQDGSTTAHSSPLSPDGSPPSHVSSPPDGEGSLRESPTPQENTEATHAHDMLDAHPMPAPPPIEETRELLNTYIKKLAVATAAITISGGLLAYYGIHIHNHRTIDPGWYVYHLSCRRLNVLKSQTSRLMRSSLGISTPVP